MKKELTEDEIKHIINNRTLVAYGWITSLASILDYNIPSSFILSNIYREDFKEIRDKVTKLKLRMKEDLDLAGIETWRLY